jgi:sugar lactone lactonase YvrE
MDKMSEGKVVRVAPDGKIDAWPFPVAQFLGGGALTLDRQGRPWVAAVPVGGTASELYAWDGAAFQRQALPDAGSIGGLYGDTDGSLWLSLPDRNAIGKLRDGKLELIPLPTPEASPGVLAGDGRGNLWFTEWHGRNLGRIGPDGALKEFPLPPEEEIPLAVKPDGAGKVWFSAAFNYSLFRLDPETGRTEEFPVPVPANWSKNAAQGLSSCTVRRKQMARSEQAAVRAETSSATEQMVQSGVLRHPKGFPRNKDAVLFEQQCQTARHTWYRMDKAAPRRSDWGPTVDRMVEFNGAAIGDQERARIIRYLNKHYALLK